MRATLPKNLIGGKAMRKIGINAALAPALALLAGPLWAQQRTPTIGTHVVACSGTFANI